MAEGIVSSVLEQLTSIIGQEIQQEVSLVKGVDKEVKKLTSNLRAIQAVLVDAEQRQVKETTVRVWLDQLKDTSYNMEDVLDEWNTAMMKSQIEGDHENTLLSKKVCSLFLFPCFGMKQIVQRQDIALQIKDINENIDDIVKAKDMLNFVVVKSTEKPEQVRSTSLVDMSKIYGRENEKNTLMAKLLCESSEEQNRLHVISIVGMGGIGKTTLAQLAYNNKDVIRKFEKRLWVCVSEPFDEFRIAKAIIEALEGSPSNLEELESLLQHIREFIEKNNFLLVLDDVWTEDYKKWEPIQRCLQYGIHGSKILITTRKETVARMVESIDTITIKGLFEEECWLLFKQIAFFGRSSVECEKLEEIGRKIVCKCKGLPLSVKTIGSLLRFKRTKEEWQHILDSEMWKLEEFEKGLLPSLLLSYYDLPSMVRRCFAYCAIFPKYYNIKKNKLIKLWMTQGYLGLEQNIEMGIMGKWYFDNLLTRSFFEEFEKDDDCNVINYKMHDIVHDFAQFLSKNECFNVEVHDVKVPFISSYPEKVHHVMLTLNQGPSFPISICNFKKLCSLIISCGDLFYSLRSDILPMLFGELTCLRALKLDICEKFITEMPNEIENLIHLRYLDLSGQKIRKLPETLCGLYNLQNLELTSCDELKELPQGIGKLINVRHLVNDWTSSLSYMPIGIQRLTNLRALSQFVASGGRGVHDSKACSLEGLKDLNHLRGHLSIRGLGNVTNVSEAKRIEILKNKKNLFCLDLLFDKSIVRERTDEDDELLLEPFHHLQT